MFFSLVIPGVSKGMGKFMEEHRDALGNPSNGQDNFTSCILYTSFFTISLKGARMKL